MSDDYILKFTNGYANYGKIEEDKLVVKDDCVITNYDPRVESGKKRGQITINLFNGEQTIEDGNGKSCKSDNKADFSRKKFSIFKEIATLDGKEELSIDDIRKMDKSFIEKWGLKDLRYDYKNGVATLVWGENDILRIDFFTKKEKKLKLDDLSNEGIPTESINPVTKSKKSLDSQVVANVVSEFTGGNIPIDDVKDLKSVAEYTGLSESYIKEILIGLEGKKQWPLCKAEYDKVPKQGFPNGFLTIGFGHTSLAGEPKVEEGLEISEKQAYQILANDIVCAIKICRNKFNNRGLAFNSFPKSIQCAIVDIVFNKGPSEINESLVANLREGYYASAARRTWFETPNIGLQKRNMYRFISAIENLNKKDKISAIKRFKSDHATQLNNVFKKDIEAKHAWNNMCSKISYKDGVF